MREAYEEGAIFFFDEVDAQTFHSGSNKDRKKQLVNARIVNCPYCKYHRCENAKGRRARTDRYKNKR